MDRLRAIQVFVEVARAESFTAAAQRLGMSRASVTKTVRALEEALGAPLLNRNTQHVSTTEAGARLLKSGARLLGDFDALEAELRDTVGRPRGPIRVGTPPSFGAIHLVPLVAAFTRENPEVRISLHLDDGAADLVRDGLDMSLRIASALKDSENIARLLVRVRQVLVAAPGYVRERGMPHHPRDLARHNCLVHALKSPGAIWHFGQGAETVSVHVAGSMRSNFGEALRSAALLGEGVSMHPMYMVDGDLSAGRLIAILPGWEPTGLEIHAIYPERRMPARVKEFIAFLRERLPREAKWLSRDPTPEKAPDQEQSLKPLHLSSS